MEALVAQMVELVAQMVVLVNQREALANQKEVFLLVCSSFSFPTFLSNR